MIAVAALAALASIASAASAASAAGPCAERVPVAVAFVEDADPRARAAVEQALDRACFDVLTVADGSEAQMLAAANKADAGALVVARAGLVEGLQEQMHGYLFSVDLTVFSADGARRGHAQRQASILGGAAQVASAREARRVADDAVKVMKQQLSARRCLQTTEVVVLWHKDSDDAARAAVLHALRQRCVAAGEQVDGLREQAIELARDLGRPLVALKAVTDRRGGGAPILVVTADRIDPTSDALVVLDHVNATADLQAVLDRMLPAPAVAPTP